MQAGGFKMLVDLPTFLQTFPKSVQGATIAAHKEALTTWRDRPAFPGLAYRFTWKASKDYGFSMRRSKYGSATKLRIGYAKTGNGMPSEAMPGAGRKNLSFKARRSPNRGKPWYVSSGGTKAAILKRKATSRVNGDQVVTQFKAGGLGLNLLSGANMRGVASATWVHVPVTYAMKVYKDAVNKAGAYTVTVTRAIPRWIRTYANRTYRQEFEDLTHDLPWIQRLAEASLRNNLRDLTVADDGKTRMKFRKAVKNMDLDPAELALINGG